MVSARSGVLLLAVTAGLAVAGASLASAASAPTFCGTYIRSGRAPNAFRVLGVRVRGLSCAAAAGTLMAFNGRRAPERWRLTRGVTVRWSRSRQNELSHGAERIWYLRYVRS